MKALWDPLVATGFELYGEVKPAESSLTETPAGPRWCLTIPRPRRRHKTPMELIRFGGRLGACAHWGLVDSFKFEG